METISKMENAIKEWLGKSFDMETNQEVQNLIDNDTKTLRIPFTKI